LAGCFLLLISNIVASSTNIKTKKQKRNFTPLLLFDENLNKEPIFGGAASPRHQKLAP
jgi:hypothetical protein